MYASLMGLVQMWHSNSSSSLSMDILMELGTSLKICDYGSIANDLGSDIIIIESLLYKV